MATDFRKFHCKKGCCRGQLIEVFEEHFLDQDDLINNLQNEHLSLLKYIRGELFPYLESLAVTGDESARDVLIDLSDFV